MCIENFMTTSNRLFGNNSTIYMATAQSRIFTLLRIYYFPTAIISIIYLLLIEQLFQQWKSPQYLITLHRKIVFGNFNYLFGNISTIYMATVQSPIFWPLYIIQVFSYCASPNYLSTANRPTISPLVIVYIF